MSSPSPLKTFHDDTYPSINPTLPHLSTKCKNIAISGGGSGNGPEIARSFAKSGASSISIFRRTSKSLFQTKSTLETALPATKIYTHVADITDRATLDITFLAIKSAVGYVDILITNARYMPNLHSIAASDPDNWRTGFEIKVRCAFNLISSFVPVASKNASIINISTAVSHMPLAHAVSGTRVFDYAAHEYPEFFFLGFHPGVIETAMDATTIAAGISFPHDSSQGHLFKVGNGSDASNRPVTLPSGSVVRAVSFDVKFLRGKLVRSNRDFDELKAMKMEIEGTAQFAFGLRGWP